MWQLTRVGVLRWVLVLKCTVCGLTNTLDFEVILYVDRHSLDGIRQVNNEETDHAQINNNFNYKRHLRIQADLKAKK